jgi:hypothetical protein
MSHILVGEIDLLAPVLFSTGDLDDWHSRSLNELNALYILLHLLLLQNVLYLSQKFERVHLLLVLSSDGNIDV